MNIFVVANDPVVAASQLCDKHLGKMLLESAQMLCSAFPEGEAPYKRAHFNHPCTIWCRSSVSNYEWLCKHAMELAAQFAVRYGKRHKSEDVMKWLTENIPSSLPDVGLTTFAQAMPDQYKQADPVEAYRKFYVFEKSRFAFWQDSSRIPEWFLEGCKANGINCLNRKESVHGTGHVGVS